MMDAGGEAVLTIEKAVAGGRMMARHDGEVVLVSGTLPGERVRAKVERRARGVALAAVIDILSASPDRRVPPVDPVCGGNAYAHIAYDRQLRLKAEVVRDTFRRLARLDLPGAFPVAPSAERGYRMRARLHVRAGRPCFFREGSHEPCRPETSGQLLPASCAVLDALEGRLEGVEAIELAENVPADERALHLTTAGRQTRLERFVELEGITGVSCDARTPSRRMVLGGTPFVSDPLRRLLPDGAGADRVIRRHASAFFQANRSVLPALLGAVVSAAGERPVDLYAGVGLFAAALVETGRTAVVAVEGEPANQADLAWNAAQYGGVLRVIDGAVEAFLATPDARRADSFILDPPRTGLSREAVAGILRAAVPTLAYVSCDVATQARDTRLLTSAGYELRHLQAFDLFPNTPHIECLAVFTRQAGGRQTAHPTGPDAAGGKASQQTGS